MEIIEFEETTDGHRRGHRRYNDIEKVYRSYRSRNKEKRCFFCGHNEGSWIEYEEYGRTMKHFLCKKCRDPIYERLNMK